MEPDEEQKSLWSELLEYYSEAEAHLWLILPHPQLDGTPPAILMAQGNFDPIWQVMDRHGSDAFL